MVDVRLYIRWEKSMQLPLGSLVTLTLGEARCLTKSPNPLRPPQWSIPDGTLVDSPAELLAAVSTKSSHVSQPSWHPALSSLLMILALTNFWQQSHQRPCGKKMPSQTLPEFLPHKIGNKIKWWCFVCLFHSMWKFLGYGLNPHLSSNPSPSSAHAGSLTCCATKELQAVGLSC